MRTVPVPGERSESGTGTGKLGATRASALPCAYGALPLRSTPPAQNNASTAIWGFRKKIDAARPSLFLHPKLRRACPLCAIKSNNMTEEFFNNIRGSIKEASHMALTEDELQQTAEYIFMFKSLRLEEHWQVNQVIAKADRWDDFKALRSMNDHGPSGVIQGITPKFFAIVCKVLKISGDDGHPLLNYRKW
jgi:hypothetical protein